MNWPSLTCLAQNGVEQRMKCLISLSANDYQIKNLYGTLLANWKTDLDEEEHDGYVPDGYTKILELSVISADKIGQGYGKKLMDEFLRSKIARSADLIFLDPNPYIGAFEDSDKTDDEQIAKLKLFYAKFGFRSHPRSARMWLVQKGNIPDSKLPL
jgi:ribosomal protein S18 acetylase RimI-like enzyme